MDARGLGTGARAYARDLRAIQTLADRLADETVTLVTGTEQGFDVLRMVYTVEGTS